MCVKWSVILLRSYISQLRPTKYFDFLWQITIAVFLGMNQRKKMSGLYNWTMRERSQVRECKLTLNEVESVHIVQIRSLTEGAHRPGRGPTCDLSCIVCTLSTSFKVNLHFLT